MIVLDASAAAAIARNTAEGKALRSLIRIDEPIVVPDLFIAEASNIAWKYVHGGYMSKEQALELHATMAMLPNSIVPSTELDVEALSQATHFDHSVYDMLYLVLARRNAATLMTCDKKLRALCEQYGVSCVSPVDM